MKHYVLCLVDTDEAAQEITQKVINAGFAKEEIFVLSSDRRNPENSADRREEEPGLVPRGSWVIGWQRCGDGWRYWQFHGRRKNDGRCRSRRTRGGGGECHRISRWSWSLRGRRARVPEEAGGRRDSRRGANRRSKDGGSRSEDLRGSSRPGNFRGVEHSRAAPSRLRLHPNGLPSLPSPRPRCLLNSRSTRIRAAVAIVRRKNCGIMPEELVRLSARANKIGQEELAEL